MAREKRPGQRGIFRGFPECDVRYKIPSVKRKQTHLARILSPILMRDGVGNGRREAQYQKNKDDAFGEHIYTLGVKSREC
jgi:hypothetical protein